MKALVTGLTPRGALPLVVLALAGLLAAVMTWHVPSAPMPSGPKVFDANGDAVRLDPNGRGVVVISSLIGEYMIGAGTAAPLQWIGSWNLDMVRDSPLGAIFPRLLTLPRSEEWRNPNLERLLRLRPTVVVPYTPLPTARSLGLPLFAFKTLREPDWWLADAPAAARLNGGLKRARQLLSAYRQDVAALRHDLPRSSKTPSVLAIAPHSDGSMGGTHEASTLNPFFTMTGARDPAIGHVIRRLNPEQLLRLDPDMIVLERTSDQTPAQFMADPRFQTLRAVQTKRVYWRPPGLAFTTTGIVEYPIYGRWLGELLYPKRMPPRLRSVMRCAYRRTFGYIMSDRQLDQLLAVDDNVGSAGYRRFTGSGSEPCGAQG